MPGSPVLLDGAQGVGAVEVDVRALGCDAYAGAGQKWLCGPDGLGMLYVSPRLRERLEVSRRGYANLADPNEGLRAGVHEDARRFDSMSLSAEAVACALAAIGILESAGWSAVHERARSLAAGLADQLADRGREPAPRDQTTLVSFCQRRSVRRAPAAGRAGVHRARHPGTSLAAGIRGRLERRERPRSTARFALRVSGSRQAATLPSVPGAAAGTQPLRAGREEPARSRAWERITWRSARCWFPPAVSEPSTGSPRTATPTSSTRPASSRCCARCTTSSSCPSTPAG